MIYVLFSCFLIIHTKIDGENDSSCSITNPCDYETSKKMVNPGNTICFYDIEVSNHESLLKLRELIQYGINNNCSIDGNGIEIRGLSCDFFYPGFIMVQKKEGIEISNISFNGFKFPTLVIIDSNISVRGICFQECSIHKMVSLVSITNSDLSLNQISFNECFAHDSQVVSILRSRVSMSSFVMNHCFLFHSSNFPLFYIMNSTVIAKSCCFMNNSMPYSPMFVLDHISTISFVETHVMFCTFTEMIMAESNSIIKYENSSISNNFGILYLSYYGSIFSIYNITFSSCNSPSSLFNNQDSSLCLNCCKIYQMSSFCLFESRGKLAKLVLDHCIFDGIFTKNAVFVKSSALYTNYNHFKDIFCDGFVLFSSFSRINVLNNIFQDNYGFPIGIDNSESTISNTSFSNIQSKGKVSIYSNHSLVTISDCSFKDESYKSLIRTKDMINISNCVFSSEKSLSLSPKLQKMCKNCAFGKRIFKKPNDYIFMIYIILLMLIVVTVFKRRINIFINKLFKKPVD